MTATPTDGASQETLDNDTMLPPEASDTDRLLDGSASSSSWYFSRKKLPMHSIWSRQPCRTWQQHFRHPI